MPNLTILNPRRSPENSMRNKNNRLSRRARRANPSGGEAAMKGARTLGKAVVGGLVALAYQRGVGGMKKADGTPRFTANQQLIAQGVVAGIAAVGASFVDHKVASDLLEGTAVVMGGTAAIGAAVHYQLPERLMGQPTTAAQQTAPGGGLYALPQSHAPAGGLYANPYSYAPHHN